jgi:hypothetical protein
MIKPNISNHSNELSEKKVTAQQALSSVKTFKYSTGSFVIGVQYSKVHRYNQEYRVVVIIALAMGGNIGMNDE